MKLKLIALVFAVSVLLGCQDTPEIALPTVSDNPFSFAEKKGQWVVLNYWAEWCKPCLHEIPELNALHADNNNLSVVSVYFDALNRAELSDLKQKYHVQYPLLMQDPKKQLNIDNITALPVNYLINPQGKVVKQLFGPQTQQSVLKEIQSQS